MRTSLPAVALILFSFLLFASTPVAANDLRSWDLARTGRAPEITVRARRWEARGGSHRRPVDRRVSPVGQAQIGAVQHDLYVRRRFALFSEVGLSGLALDDGAQDDLAVLEMLLSPFVGAGARFTVPLGQLAFRLSWPPSVRVAMMF